MNVAMSCVFLFKNIPGLRRLKKNMAALLVNDLNSVARRCTSHQATPPPRRPPPPPLSAATATPPKVKLARTKEHGLDGIFIRTLLGMRCCSLVRCAPRGRFTKIVPVANPPPPPPAAPPLVFLPSMSSFLQGLLVTRTVSFLCAGIVSVVLEGHLVNKRDVPRRLQPDEPPPPGGRLISAPFVSSARSARMRSCARWGLG
jgi:hypothetical protein